MLVPRERLAEAEALAVQKAQTYILGNPLDPATNLGPVVTAAARERVRGYIHSGIEEGLPLIRSANTGISAVVDPYGRILDSLPLGVEGVLDTALPKPIEPPLFSRYPLWTFGVMQILMILLAGSFRIRRPFSG